MGLSHLRNLCATPILAMMVRHDRGQYREKERKSSKHLWPFPDHQDSPGIIKNFSMTLLGFTTICGSVDIVDRTVTS